MSDTPGTAANRKHIPTLCVSFADSTSIDLFFEDILTLARLCTLHIAAPDALLEERSELKTLAAMHSPLYGGWRDSIAFANKAVTLDLEHIPFVLRLPLCSETLEERTASTEALQALATPGAFAAVSDAF